MTDTEIVPGKRDREPADRAPLVDAALADELLARAQTEGVELLGPDGLLSQVTKAVLERALAEEMTEHLGYEKHDPAGRGSGNSRNGVTGKQLLTEIGGLDLEVPRDRSGSSSNELEDKIVALYARGLTTRDIRAHLREMYDVDVSPDLISRVIDAVLDELQEWQSRPLDRVYPVVFIDALMVKIRDGVVANRPVYLAIGIDCDGAKNVLGLWVGPSTGESSKFWLTVLSELKSRGVADVCIVCCDGLTGLPDAITVVWPQATVQLCVVHLIGASLRYASKKDWGALTKDLRLIYTAVDEQAAGAAMDVFAEKWSARYPTIVKLWRSHWAEFVPFLAFPPDVRRVVYTTDENVNSNGLTWRSCGPPRRRTAAGDRRPAAAVKVERPVGRTTLTAARTAVASAAVGAGDRRAKSRTQGLEVLPRCYASTA